MSRLCAGEWLLGFDFVHALEVMLWRNDAIDEAA
jgi:hypothetical protein